MADAGAIIVVRGGFQDGRRYVLGPSTTIGRSAACEVQIEDRALSRRHCVIEWDDEAYLLRDLGSTNGTSVNGVPVRDRQRLRYDDLIKLGTTTLVLREEGSTQISATLLDRQQGEVVDEARVVGTSALELGEPASGAALEEQNAALPRALEKQRVIRRVGEAISRLVDSDELFEIVINQLVAALPVERAVALLGSAPDALEVTAVRNLAAPGEDVPVSRSMLKRAFSRRQGLCAEIAGGRTSPARTVLLAPLVHGREALGAIQIDNASQDQPFDAEDIKVLMAVAAQASVALQHQRLLRQIEEQRRVRDQMSRYLPHQLVEQFAGDRIQLATGGRACRLVLLFSDLRGFTPMAERLEPTVVVAWMNEYFERMVEVLFRHQGTLDKFIGDAIMAFWGAPVSAAGDPISAVRCAVDMQAELYELNKVRAKAGEPPLEMGIGLHAGNAVVGNVGSARRMEYTALGSTVNLASRVESVARAGEILLTPELYKLVADQVSGEWREPAELKGLSEQVQLFHLESVAVPEEQDAGRSPSMPFLDDGIPARFREGAAAESLPATLHDISDAGCGVALRVDPSRELEPATLVEIALTGDAHAVLTGRVDYAVHLESEGEEVLYVELAWAGLDAIARRALHDLLDG